MIGFDTGTRTILKKELLIASRQRHVFLMRVVYLLVLFGVAWITNMQWSYRLSSGLESEAQKIGFSITRASEDQKLRASLNREIFTIYAWVQLFFVLIAAPLLGARALFSERGGGTYQLLLISGLSQKEIVKGKFIAAVSVLIGVILSGVPLIAIFFPFGGVSILQVLTVILLLSGVAAFGISIGLREAGVRKEFQDTILISAYTYLKFTGFSIILSIFILYISSSVYCIIIKHSFLMGFLFLVSLILMIGLARIKLWGGFCGILIIFTFFFLLKVTFSPSFWYIPTLVHPISSMYAAVSGTNPVISCIPGWICGIMCWGLGISFLGKSKVEAEGYFTTPSVFIEPPPKRSIPIKDDPVEWAEKKRLAVWRGEWTWIVGLGVICFTAMSVIENYDSYMGFISYIFFMCISIAASSSFTVDAENKVLILITGSSLSCEEILAGKFRAFISSFKPLFLWVFIPVLIFCLKHSPLNAITWIPLFCASAAFIYMLNIFLSLFFQQRLYSIILGFFIPALFLGISIPLFKALLGNLGETVLNFLNPVYSIANGGTTERFISAAVFAGATYFLYQYFIKSFASLCERRA